ncbi:hypothetical protein Tco_1540381 [Tanacetum coccineum]
MPQTRRSMRCGEDSAIKQYFQIQELCSMGVWMNKPDFDTMGLDDLYNNFKIVEQKVKKSAGASNDDKNLAFVNYFSFSDATTYAFLSTQPKGSQLVHEDLEQLHDDDLEELDLVDYGTTKHEEKESSIRELEGKSSLMEAILLDMINQSSTKTVKIEDASEKAMCVIDGAGLLEWTGRGEEIQANMALMAFSDSEYDDLLVKLSDTDFKAATYKRGLATLEGQIVKYKEHEVLFSEEIALLKRSVGCKEYELGLLRTELEKITDKSKKGVGLEEFKEPEVNEYGPRDSSLKPTTGCDKESDNSKENTDDSLEQHQMTDTQTSSFESPLKVDKDWKEKFFYPANHVESVNQIEKPVKRTVRYADKSLVKEQV